MIRFRNVWWLVAGFLALASAMGGVAHAAASTYKVAVKGAVVETGKFLSVSRKKDGKWLYIRDTWHADALLAPAAPPAAKK
jgi:hypothetical protein